MPPKSAAKKAAPKGKGGPRGMAKPIPPGILMTDLAKKNFQWKLGPVIGQGGFGYIYLGGPGSKGDITTANAEHVIKVEPHANGPLFVELAFYMRIAKTEMVSAWMKKKKFSHLGLPLYLGSGAFEHGGNKYRFMVIDRFATDIEKLLIQNGNIFPEKTVYSLGLRILDVLEYLHDHDYVHADIKSSNLMMGFKKGDTSKVYLLDYGLACKYKPGGTHAVYKEDPRRKHDGTIEYTSRDAHKGVVPSRRADMEILGYCMVQWLCKTLPWEDKLQDKDYVFKQKEKYMGNLKEFMSKCFTKENHPDVLEEYLGLVNKLRYDEEPDYDKIRKMFRAGMKKCGVNDDGKTICLPSTTVKTPRKPAANTASSPNKSRAALKDLPCENSPKKTRTPVKRAKSPVKKSQTPLKRIEGELPKASPRKVPLTMTSECSPMKKVQASQGVRRSPRKHVHVSSDESSGEDNAKTLNVKRVKTYNSTSHDTKLVNGVVGTSTVVVIDGVERTVHRRPRRKNVPTRDFAQSP